MIGLVSWLQYFPHNDYAHTFWSSALMVGVVIYFIKDLIKKLKVKSKKLKVTIFLVFLLFIFYDDISIRIGYKSIADCLENGVSIKKPKVLKHILVPAEEAMFLEKFDEQLQKGISYQKDKVVVNFTYCLVCSSFTENRENFYPYYMYGLIYGEGLEDFFHGYDEKFRSYICNKHPVIIDNKLNPIVFKCEGKENEVNSQSLYYQTVAAFNYPVDLYDENPYVFIKIPVIEKGEK